MLNVLLNTLKTLNRMLQKMEMTRQQLSTERLAMIKIDAQVNVVAAKAGELNELGDGLTIHDLTKLQQETQSLEDKVQGRL